MKRLTRKAEGNIVYKFHSPITVNIGDEDSWRSETYSLKVDNEFENSIKEAVNSSMNEMGNEGLARHIDLRNGLYDLIISIIVTVKNQEAVTIVTAKEELDSHELSDLKEYITGQFSDGWGEGFEQQQLEEWNDSYDEPCEDEEDGEPYMEKVNFKATMSASFWNSKNWSITLE